MPGVNDNVFWWDERHNSVADERIRRAAAKARAIQSELDLSRRAVPGHEPEIENYGDVVAALDDVLLELGQ